MNEEFKHWFAGISMFFVAAFILWFIGGLVNPQNHFSLLEWWGIIMLAVVVRSGVIEYYNNEDE